MNIYDHLLENLSTRTKKLNTSQMKLAISLNNEGNSYKTISSEFSIPKSTIGWFFKKYKMALKKFESIKPEVNSGEAVPASDQNVSVNNTIAPRDPCVCPPAADPTTNKFPWGPVLAIVAVLLLFYFFVLKSDKS